jgi:hypothetical protein
MNDSSQRPTFVEPRGAGPSYRDAVTSGALEAAYRAPAPRKTSADEQRSHLSHYGDAAGEYIGMDRGRYDAWIYVGIAFLGQLGLLGLLPAMLAVYLASAAEAGPDVVTAAGFIAGGAAGAAGAFFTFRDRWRCIEAFSSRFCSGVANLSLLYVPIIALIYANIRGVQKLVGR